MRRRLGTLAGTTGLVLAATIMVAAPAEARRNVGGLVGEVCVPPGHAEIKPDGPGLGANCICITQDLIGGTVVIAGPNGKCPAGIVQLHQRR